jgi:hypothetical protein
MYFFHTLLFGLFVVLGGGAGAGAGAY